MFHVFLRSDRGGGCAHDALACFVRRPVGIAEIPANSLLDFGRLIQEPEDDEKRHHGSDEISVSDFPRAAVVAAVAAFFLDDDDGSFTAQRNFSMELRVP